MNKSSNIAISLSLLIVMMAFAGCQQQAATNNENAQKGVAEEMVMKSDETVKGTIEIVSDVVGEDEGVTESATGKIEVVDSESKTDVQGKIEVVSE